MNLEETLNITKKREKIRDISSIYDKELYVGLFENNHAVMLLIDPETGQIIDGNPAACNYYGYSSEQLRKKRITEINTLTEEELYKEMQRAKKGQKNCFNFSHRLATGEIREVESYSGTILVGELKLLYSIVIDVTEKKRTEEKIREAHTELKQIFNIASDGMCLIDNDFNIVRANKNYERIVGHLEVEGRKCFEVFPSVNCRTPSCPLNRIKAGNEVIEHEVKRVNKAGVEIYCVTTARAFRNASEEVVGILENIRDVTEKKQAEQKINFMAYHDALTELPNRYQFNDFLKNSLEKCKADSESLGVMFIDLDRFKMVNDTMGHSFGDLLLQQAANRLKNCIRKKDVVARYGGDEFIILLDGIIEEGVAKVADRIIEEMSKPFILDKIELFTTPSIGISIYPKDGIDEETLIKNADTAMYSAKQRGRNNYQFYSANLNETNARQLLLENGLRKALENNEFSLHYQPQIDLITGEVVGFEALLRWNSPQFGSISPLEFIPLAEESGLIIPIGKWVLEMACRQNRNWQDQGLTPIRVAINISAKQFQDERFVETVMEVLEETQLDPAYLELEITESFMQNIGELNLILKKLKSLGVGVAVDDFGTGYCSLSILRDLPVDKVKIDQSFVRNMAADSNTNALVKTIINMGHNLKFKVTAEGVEDIEQLSFLRENKCDFGQGYVFSKPLPPNEIKGLLANQRTLFSSR